MKIILEDPALDLNDTFETNALVGVIASNDTNTNTCITVGLFNEELLISLAQTLLCNLCPSLLDRAGVTQNDWIAFLKSAINKLEEENKNGSN